LTSTPIKVEVASHVLLALCVLGTLNSTKEVAMGLLRTKLSLFPCSLIPLEIFSPLKWWENMRSNFLILDYLHVMLWRLWALILKPNEFSTWLGSSQV
jgi:hypothetical protein